MKVTGGKDKERCSDHLSSSLVSVVVASNILKDAGELTASLYISPLELNGMKKL